MQQPTSVTDTSTSSAALPQAMRWTELDGLRGVAIAMVVVVHFWAHSSKIGTGVPIVLEFLGHSLDLSWVAQAGQEGVRIFFVLSGFLLHRIWIEDARPVTEKVRRFFWKRIR